MQHCSGLCFSVHYQPLSSHSDNPEMQSNRGKLTPLQHSSSGLTKTKASPLGQPGTDICSPFKGWDSQRYSPQDLLYTYADDDALFQSHPVFQFKTKINLLLADVRVGATWFLLQSPASHILHSSMHQWDPTGSKPFLVVAPSPHSQHTLFCASETTSCQANDLQTWRGTCMHLFPFISLSTCMCRNLYSVANAICIILYRLQSKLIKEMKIPGLRSAVVL